MLIRKRRAGDGDIPSSEITPYQVYLDRRRFLAQGAAAAVGAAVLPNGLAGLERYGRGAQQVEEPTPYEDITTYNNYYEFGTDKGDPARYSGDFKPLPWSVTVEGECGNPGTFALED